MLKKVLVIICIVVSLLVLWQVGETYVSHQRILRNVTALDAFIPTPVTIYKTYIVDGSKIAKELSYTLIRALMGFIIGTLFAFFIAVIFSRSIIFRRSFYPIIFGINSFPIVGLAPLIILIFGQGSSAGIVFISALICYFPILVALETAFKETDKELLDLMHVLNAKKSDILFKIQIPLAVPYFLMAIKLAIPASIIGATIGEWLGTRNGIGQIITVALYQLKPGLLYASLIAVMAVCLLCVFFVSSLQKVFIPWRRNN